MSCQATADLRKSQNWPMMGSCCRDGGRRGDGPVDNHRGRSFFRTDRRTCAPRRSCLPCPEQGQIVNVRGATWAVADVRAQGLPRSPADEGEPGLTHVVRLAVPGRGPAGPGARGRVGARGRPHRRPRPGPAGDDQPGRLRRPEHARRLRGRRPLGRGHLGGRQHLPVAVPQRRERRGLPARAAAPRAAVRADEPAARRRRGPGQDHRGGPGPAGAAAAAPRPVGDHRLPAEPVAEVAGRDAGEVRPGIRDRQQRADGPGAAQPRAERQPVPAVPAGDRVHGVAAVAARPAAAARRVRRRPGHRHARGGTPSTCSSWTRRTTSRPRARPASPGSAATRWTASGRSRRGRWPRSASTGCSCPRPRTTATPSRSPR